MALFSPFKALGLVCSDTPPYLHILGNETFIVCPLGKSFQILSGSNLGTKNVSAPLRKRIRWACSSFTCFYR